MVNGLKVLVPWFGCGASEELWGRDRGDVYRWRGPNRKELPYGG